MKKAIAVVCCLTLLSGCARSLDAPNGVTYPSYGLFNAGSYRSDKVCYALSVGNIIWSVILFESVIFPIYFVGFSIYNPLRLKKSTDDSCGFDG